MLLLIPLQAVTTIVGIIAAIIIVIIVLAIIGSSIRIVPQYERLVVFRLGRFVGVRGPGIVMLRPFVDSAKRVDIREQVITISKQTCITKDNVPVDIDLLTYLKIVEPDKAVLEVQDYKSAAIGIATTALRAIIGAMTLDEVLSGRETINSTLRAKLDEATQRWGVKVTSVEIREIIPPKNVQDAMEKQMAAERERRAMIALADGQKQSEILKAEGEKQAAILRAEGDAQATITRAQAEAQAAQAQAQALVNRMVGTAGSYRQLADMLKSLDDETFRRLLMLQYLEVLRALASSQNTKYVMIPPFENLMKSIQELLGLSK